MLKLFASNACMFYSQRNLCDQNVLFRENYCTEWGKYGVQVGKKT